MSAFLCLVLKGEGRARLLEFQQGQKIKKMGCWSSSKAEKSKRWAAGVPARAKNQKDGLLEFQQGQKNQKDGRREIPQAKKSKRWASGNSDAVFFHNEKCWRRPKSRTFVGN